MKHKLKLLAVGVAAALSSFGALAETFTYENNPLPFFGSFSHTFNFTISQLSNAEIGVNTFFYDVPASLPDVFFQFDAGPVITSIKSYAGGTASFGYIFSGLAAGSHSLKVSGPEAGSFGETYSLQITTAPVPEPETYAMLMAGLGLMSVVARRRKSV